MVAQVVKYKMKFARPFFVLHEHKSFSKSIA